jgi:hypothetical protein
VIRPPAISLAAAGKGQIREEMPQEELDPKYRRAAIDIYLG